MLELLYRGLEELILESDGEVAKKVSETVLFINAMVLNVRNELYFSGE